MFCICRENQELVIVVQLVRLVHLGKRVSQVYQDLPELRASRVSEATTESQDLMGCKGHQETLGNQEER
ncbi:hypothetical protein AALO_G00221160 [Alosa alosa]|uniref:Uncharacterized protein n=1 Tax=Alosa alosa TaxID=278164 RepID=A0AAV6G451_9TELE|nr:hypothetical protein AALO_G00221160 [Alosa alosa]